MHRKSNQVILALLWIHFFLLNDQVKQAHDKMNRSNHYRHLNRKKKKSLSTPSFQGRRQLRTHPEWYFPMPLIRWGFENSVVPFVFQINQMKFTFYMAWILIAQHTW